MAFSLGSFGPGGPCDCCGDNVLVSCCRPCVIPKEDLQFTEKFYQYDTSGFPWTSTLLSTQTITLTYNSLGGPFVDTWTGSILCPDSVTRTVTLHCVEDFPGANTGLIHITMPQTQAPFTTFDYQPFNTGGGAQDVGTYTCSPFHAHHQFFGDDGNGFIVVPVGEIDIEDVQHAVYTGTCCLSPITLGGCGGAPVAGASYGVWEDSTKAGQIAAGTTDSNGLFSFDAVKCGTTWYREVSHPRFVTVAGTKTYVGTDTDTISTPASGYHCLAGTSPRSCGLPVADTLHCTFATAGSKTLAYSAGAWGGSWTASGHSYVMSIDAATAALTLTRDGVSCGASMAVNSCPPSLSISVGIPAGDCLTELGNGTITE